MEQPVKEYTTYDSVTKPNGVLPGKAQEAGQATCHWLAEPDDAQWDEYYGYRDRGDNANTELIPYSNTITRSRTPYPHVLFTRCYHNRVTIQSLPSLYRRGLVQFSWINGEPVAVVTNRAALFYRDCGYWRGVPRIYSPEEKDVHRAQEAALLSLLAGKPRQHMNVARTLIELKDVKTTISDFSKFVRWCLDVRRGGIKLPKLIAQTLSISREGIPRTSCRTLAKAYLWWNFGVAPTISDVETAIKEWSKGKLSVKGLKHRSFLLERTYAAGYHVERRDSPARKGGRVYIPTVTHLDGGDGDFYANMQYGSPVRHCEPRIPHLADGSVARGFIDEVVEGKVFAKTRREGAWAQKSFPSSMSWSCPLFRTAWELVPFSFVIDWVVNVGDAIERFDKLTYIATTRFAFGEPWITIKRTRTWYEPYFLASGQVEAHVTKRKGNTVYWHQEGAIGISAMDMPYKREVIFQRLPASEVGISYADLWRGLVPEWSGPVKVYQITTGMALLESLTELI